MVIQHVAHNFHHTEFEANPMRHLTIEGKQHPDRKTKQWRNLVTSVGRSRTRNDRVPKRQSTRSRRRLRLASEFIGAAGTMENIIIGELIEGCQNTPQEFSSGKLNVGIDWHQGRCLRKSVNMSIKCGAATTIVLDSRNMGGIFGIEIL